MGLDDVFSTESAFVAAATAAVFSPKTRETVRKGAVYGVAGALKVGDVVSGAARGVVNGVRGEQAEANGAPSTAAASSTPARRTSSRTSGRTNRSTGTSRSGSGGSRSAARQAAATAKSGGTATG